MVVDFEVFDDSLVRIELSQFESLIAITTISWVYCGDTTFDIHLFYHQLTMTLEAVTFHTLNNMKLLMGEKIVPSHLVSIEIEW